MNPYRPEPRPPRTDWPIYVQHLVSALGVVTLLAVLFVPVGEGCKPGQPAQVVQLLTPAGACIASSLLAGGATDPLAIVAGCAGTTIDDVIQVIEMLIAAQPADAGTSPLAQRLAAVHVRALGIKGVVIVKPEAGR